MEDKLQEKGSENQNVGLWEIMQSCCDRTNQKSFLKISESQFDSIIVAFCTL